LRIVSPTTDTKGVAALKKPGAVTLVLPRIFHLIWFGPKPDWFDEYIQSWKKFHPGWQFVMWGNGDAPTHNKEFFDRAEEIAGDRAHQLRADIMRYSLLLEYGGVYIDCDLKCQKAIDPLLPGVDCFAAWETTGVWVNNAIVGACQGHPLIQALVDNLPSSIENGNGRPNVISGPQYLTKQLAKYRNTGHDITVLPKDFFYPYLWDELERGDEEFPEAYAVHRWNNRRRETHS
jgi:mannosyltransferase OCH1-like enzyme